MQLRCLQVISTPHVNLESYEHNYPPEFEQQSLLNPNKGYGQQSHPHRLRGALYRRPPCPRRHIFFVSQLLFQILVLLWSTPTTCRIPRHRVPVGIITRIVFEHYHSCSAYFPAHTLYSQQVVFGAVVVSVNQQIFGTFEGWA